MTKPVKEPQAKKIGAGVTGATVGTVMTYLAANIEDPETKKNFLLMIPTVSVGASVVVYKLIRVCHARYLQYQIDQQQQRLDARARKQLEDPNASEDHKKQARKQYEQLQQQSMQSEMDNLRMLLETKKAMNNDGTG